MWVCMPYMDSMDKETCMISTAKTFPGMSWPCHEAVLREGPPPPTMVYCNLGKVAGNVMEMIWRKKT